SPTNTTAKGSLAGFATASTTTFGLASPQADGDGDNASWWPVRWLFNTDSLIARDREQQPVEISYTAVPAEVPAQTMVFEDGIGRYLAETETGTDTDETGSGQVMSSGKADMLIVNRSAKSDNLGRAAPDYDQLGSASDVLDGGANPLRFE
ncbi:MAG: hypothetical protein M3N38_10310, partial [Pseudomonadota bacterium]|nr:hypothetical protein [Pseudomonadota bacterium]